MSPKPPQFAVPAYGVPPEINSWYQSIILYDSTLRTPNQARIAAILSDKEVIRTMQRLTARLRRQHEDWPECLINFLHVASQLPDQIPEDVSITPKLAQDLLADTRRLAFQLEANLKKYPSLFIKNSYDSMIPALHNLANEIENRYKGAIDEDVGPAVGNCSGKNDAHNWIAKNISTIAELYLRARFPVFVAAVASVLTGSPYNERRIRELN